MYSDWKHALELYRQKIATHFDQNDEYEKKHIEEIIYKKIENIESLSESMISHGEILKMDLFGDSSQALLAMKVPVSAFLQPLLDGEVQNLLRRQADNNNWPTLLSYSILQECQLLPSKYRNLLTIHNDFQQSVILLPMLLAWKSLSQESSRLWSFNACEIFKIQQIINFDEDWFNVTFKLLSAWLSQQDLLENI